MQSANPEYFATSLPSKQVVVADNNAESFNESTTQIEASVEPTEKLKGWALSKVQEKVKSCASEADRHDLVCPAYLRLGDLNEIEVKTLPAAWILSRFMNIVTNISVIMLLEPSLLLKPLASIFQNLPTNLILRMVLMIIGLGKWKMCEVR